MQIYQLKQENSSNYRSFHNLCLRARILTSTIRTQKWDKLIQSNSFMTGLLKVCQASDSWKGEGTHFCSSDLIFNDFSVVFETFPDFRHVIAESD